jgi:hypothetical protein
VKGRKDERVIRASELGQYCYCARAWWLSTIMGVQPDNVRDLYAGSAAHERHGRTVWLAGALRIAAAVLAIIAVIVLLIAFL